MSIQHNYPYDPTYGFTREQLLQIRREAAPEDFEDFWRSAYLEIIRHKPDYKVDAEIWSPDPDVRIYQVHFYQPDGTRIVMWISRPKESKGGLLIGQGYGNMATPAPAENPGLTVALPNIRGLGLSQCKEIPWDTSKHALHGISTRETYVLRGAVCDLWMAASVMLDMFPDTAGNLNYQGGSLGGGMGALMLPWDNRFRAGYLNVPTLGGKVQFHYGTLPDDPGEMRRQYALSSPEGMQVLSYFDASAAASFLRIPILITPALFDPSVPPPAQFAIANAIPEEYRTMRIREVGHFAPTEQDRILEKELELLRKKLFRLD